MAVSVLRLANKRRSEHRLPQAKPSSKQHAPIKTAPPNECSREKARHSRHKLQPPARGLGLRGRELVAPIGAAQRQRPVLASCTAASSESWWDSSQPPTPWGFCFVRQPSTRQRPREWPSTGTR
eukprot:TRINITY_DN35964_c0_g2_i1.p2 TRINITY_DN35964_c0_g2~~TRINITY_DN35964_c0_g2_i1.p2  ORF type:complete len:124 (-),score=8.06 TRINITY_DN35964_c0_g2_i1:27-398(-)